MQNPSQKHQKLVAALIYYFKNKLGYEILSASYANYKDPPKHGRHEPDIIALDKRNRLHIAEAKLGDDIFSKASIEQFIDFSNRVKMDNNTSVLFHIIVYGEDELSLKNVLNRNGLGQKIGNVIQIWTLKP